MPKKKAPLEEGAPATSADLIKLVNDKFGEGSLMTFDPKAARKDVEVVSTGSLSLDITTGIGGMPMGRIVEVYGSEASGKTTLSLQTIAQAQKKGIKCAFIDAEHALDVNYAEALGVNLGELLLSQPDNGEQALEIVDTLASSGGVRVIVVDSVAALVPKSELEGEMGDPQMGKQARLMSQAMRKLTHSLHKNNCLCIFINQTRMKIGVMFGSPVTTTGGNALKFFASMRIDIARIGAIKDGDTVLGNRTRVKIIKNKFAPPFVQTEFDIFYGKGVSKEGELIEMGVDLGFVNRSGSWFSYKEERIGQGKPKAVEFLRSRVDISSEIENAIRSHFDGKEEANNDHRAAE